MKRQITFMAAIGAAVVFGLSARTFAVHADRGCHNCHVPHHAGPPDTETHPERAYGVPLWSPVSNLKGTVPDYTLYTSKTFANLSPTIVQPQGPSKLCLGCHDGAGTHNDADAFKEGTQDLVHSHPLSVVYDSDLASHSGGGLYDPNVALSGLTPAGTVDADMLDDQHMVQCTSCHDPHMTAQDTTLMLRFQYDTSNGTDNIVCRKCHNK